MIVKELYNYKIYKNVLKSNFNFLKKAILLHFEAKILWFLQLGIVAFLLNPVAFLQPLTVNSIKTQ